MDSEEEPEPRTFLLGSMNCRTSSVSELDIYESLCFLFSQV